MCFLSLSSGINSKVYKARKLENFKEFKMNNVSRMDNVSRTVEAIAHDADEVAEMPIIPIRKMVQYADRMAEIFAAAGTFNAKKANRQPVEPCDAQEPKPRYM